MNLAVINNRIGTIRRGTKNRRQYIHDTLVGIVMHADVHRDCTAAHKLVRAVEPQIRSSIVKYLGMVSPINVRMGKTAVDDKASLRKTEQNGYNPFDIDRARALKYWELETEKKAPKVYNLTSFREDLAALLKRYTEKAKELSDADRISITQDINTLHAAIATNGQREQTPARTDYDTLSEEGDGLRNEPLADVNMVREAA